MSELKAVYETGQGTLKVRGTWEEGEGTKNADLVVITSIPYAVNKATLVERIAAVVTGRKMPLITDVREHITGCPQDDDMCLVVLRRD